jgi:hypothetical protein
MLAREVGAYGYEGIDMPGRQLFRQAIKLARGAGGGALCAILELGPFGAAQIVVPHRMNYRNVALRGLCPNGRRKASQDIGMKDVGSFFVEKLSHPPRHDRIV